MGNNGTTYAFAMPDNFEHDNMYAKLSLDDIKNIKSGMYNLEIKEVGEYDIQVLIEFSKMNNSKLVSFSEIMRY